MFCWGPHYASEVKLCIMYVRSVSFQKKKKKNVASEIVIGKDL